MHQSVLQKQIVEVFKYIDSIDFVDLNENPIVVDCTLGYGGHSLALLESYPHIHIYAFDRDEYALSLASKRLESYRNRIHLFHQPFSHIFSHLSAQVCSRIKGIIADIGVSSMQLDEVARGFSFNSPLLDMRMDTQQNLTAAHIVNTYSSHALENLFRSYGEFKESKKLAQLIVERRKREPFQSCFDLSSFVEQHFRRQGLHPATLVFQALRIEVNDELGELQKLLDSLSQTYDKGYLRGARVGIISFHSLEDRLVKQNFKQWSKSCICPQETYKCECGNHHEKGYILTKKPIVPDSDEITHNKRARSAKLRVFEYRND
ncbi:16S rRNA (cytosine(1402)-N(4))-methyltransferase RsmH [Helicobacter sp. MIT 05-5293]|uniref:16S rRNA (cytosine(1402)-N(4))-methyltransferase RsmH n=1 Tax=Helicobacter sp. MIT 05-5293 TaxID=1548149 RepID=UPI0009DDB2F7|nr:16S rRNA (cytosine(1402)-N(4))-methyltransferase RsmH [Helicobacter sp. MIT 05-5293]TLD80941.1 16S rRNA (cytosine(1402)-N(4))-methyltransferase RsmH [Helicobacter sp. MIT 05-5293]